MTNPRRLFLYEKISGFHESMHWEQPETWVNFLLEFSPVKSVFPEMFR